MIILRRNWTVARRFPVLFIVHWKYIVVIGWSSLLLKITWEIALCRKCVQNKNTPGVIKFWSPIWLTLWGTHRDFGAPNDLALLARWEVVFGTAIPCNHALFSHDTGPVSPVSTGVIKIYTPHKYGHPRVPIFTYPIVIIRTPVNTQMADDTNDAYDTGGYSQFWKHVNAEWPSMKWPIQVVEITYPDRWNARARNWRSRD